MLIRGTLGKNSLFLDKKKYKAESGADGGGNQMNGRRGSDYTILVPLGTEVYKDDKLIGDIVDEENSVIVANGGEGRKGTQHMIKMSFRSNYANYTVLRKSKDFIGEAGEVTSLLLKLKSIADFGLVGFPNAGKSSILGAISRKKPKVASYAFTTVTPSIGTMLKNEKHIAIADIPGITETSESKELDGIVSMKSHGFLQHVERTKSFLYTVGVPSKLELGFHEQDYMKTVEDRMKLEFRTLIAELEKYEPGLTTRKSLLVINKVDNLMDMFDMSEEEAIQKAIDIGVSMSSDTSLEIVVPIKKIVAISVTDAIGIQNLQESIYDIFVD